MHSHKVSPVYIQGSQFISMHLKVYPGILVGFQGISRYPKVSQGISRYPQGFLHGFIHPKVSQGISRYLKVSPGIPRIHPRIHPSQGISRYLQVSPGIPRDSPMDSSIPRYPKVSQGISRYLQVSPGFSRNSKASAGYIQGSQGISRIHPVIPRYIKVSPGCLHGCHGISRIHTGLCKRSSCDCANRNVVLIPNVGRWEKYMDR